MTVVLAYLSLVGWVFVALYSVRAVRLPGRSRWLPWWRSAVGVNLMVFTASIALITTIALVSNLWPGSVPRWAWLASLCLVAAALTHRLAIRVRDMRTERREYREMPRP